MSTTHNKKRNSCLIYEFLVRHISTALVNDDKKSSNAALRILKQYYRPGTELYKEFRLLNALATTSVSSEAVAVSILSEAKSAARSHDVRQLDAEKTALIHSINRSISDVDFYDQPISEYKTLATTQSLINFWRMPNHDFLDKQAQYEDTVLRHLVTQKEVRDAQKLNEESIGTNRLLFKVLLRKINDKYSGTLTTEQKSLLKAYAFSEANGDDTIVKKMTEIKSDLLNSLDQQLLKENSNSYMSKKLREVRDEVLTTSVSPTDDNITKFMLFTKLKTEIISEE
jgi:hypothetical protein